MLFIEGRRDSYGTDGCVDTCTIAELRDYLDELCEWGHDDEPIYLTNDGGYTFGSIYIDDLMLCTDEEEYHNEYGRW